MRGRSVWIAGAVGIAALAAFWALRSGSVPATPPAATRWATPTSVADREPAALPEPGLPEPDLDEAPGDSLPEASGPAHLRIDPKLADEPLSEVPHRVLGAWDDQPETPEAGLHRVFVVVVDPKTPTGTLEALVRDIRDRHRDAEVLDVRVYGDADSATGGAQGTAGEGNRELLLADVKRNDRLGYDEVRVRGASIAP